MEVVNEILSDLERNKCQAVNSIEVNKLIEPDVFAENLLIADTNEINCKELHANQEEYILNYARDCMQYMINKLSSFPKETKDGINFTKCSGPVFCIPREKPIPIPKPLTKWQKFAKEKGIKKVKKPRVTWDDILQKWVPTYGYKKVAAEKQKEWLIEVPKNVDPKTDMFAEKQKVKKENIAKNEYQRLRNIAASKKIKVPDVGVPPMEGNLQPSQFQIAASVAKCATASLGKFQPNLPGEKNITRKKIVKSRRTPFKNAEEEKNCLQAINKQLQEERTRGPIQHQSSKEDKPKTKKKSNRKKGKSSFKKPKPEKGKKPGKHAKSGRKRR